MLKDKLPDGTVRFDGLSLRDIFDAIYPVGSIYMTVSSTNPAGKFGGTWVAWGSGRVPVGVDSLQAEFNSVEKTDGAKTVALSAAELPSHTHPISGTITLSASGAASGGTTENGGTSVAQGTTTSRFGHPVAISTAGATGATGSGNAHNNLQPYITCYMWKRTA